MSTTICSKCNTQNKSASVFCGGCGAELATGGSTPPPPPTSPPVAPTPMPQTPVAPQSQSAPAMLRCPRCGISTAAGSPFCAGCGFNFYGAQPAPHNPGKGLGIAGMVLGIISLVFFWTAWIAIICAIVGLVLSISGRNRTPAGMKNGMAVAGIVTSCIAIGLGLLPVLFGFLFVGAASTPFLFM